MFEQTFQPRPAETRPVLEPYSGAGIQDQSSKKSEISRPGDGSAKKGDQGDGVILFYPLQPTNDTAIARKSTDSLWQAAEQAAHDPRQAPLVKLAAKMEETVPTAQPAAIAGGYHLADPQQRLRYMQDRLVGAVAPGQQSPDLAAVAALHYKQATTAKERDEALNFLREAVLHGDRSAAFSLSQLTAVDATLRLTAAEQALHPGPKILTPNEFDAIQRAKVEACKDLAGVLAARTAQLSTGEKLFQAPKNNDGKQPAQPEQKQLNELTKAYEQFLAANGVSAELFKNQVQSEHIQLGARLDGFRDSFMQRDVAGAAVQAKLLNHLLSHTDGKGASLSDPELRKQVEDGLKSGSFSSKEKQLVEQLLKGGLSQNGTDLLCIWLRQDLQKERGGIVEELRTDARKQIHLSADVDAMSKNFESLNNTINLDLAVKECAAILRMDGELRSEAGQQAIKNLTAQLQEAQRLGMDGNHPFSVNIGNASTKFLSDLKSHPDGSFLTPDNLKKFSECLADNKSQIDQIRQLQIVKDLSPTSSTAEFEQARGKMEKELRDGKLEDGKENPQTQQWLSWIKANCETVKISEAAARGDLNAVQQSVKHLTDAAVGPPPDPIARAAVAAFIAGGADKSSIGGWFSNFGEFDGKPIFVANLEGIPKEQQQKLAENAALSLAPLRGSNLTEREASAVALAIAGCKDSSVSLKLEKILYPYQGASVSPETLSGILFAVKQNGEGAKSLVNIYLAGAKGIGSSDPDAFFKQFPTMKKLAEEGNPAALMIMAAITGGAVEIAPARVIDGKYCANKESFAAEGAKVMEKIAASGPDGLKAVVSTLNQRVRNYSDDGQMLHLLGTLGARLPESEKALLKEVKDNLCKHFASSSPFPDDQREKALDGFIAMSNRWTAGDAQQVLALIKPNDTEYQRQINEQIWDALVRLRDQLPAQTREAIASHAASSFQQLRNDAGAVRAMQFYAGDLPKQKVEALAEYLKSDNHLPGGLSADAKERFRSDAAVCLINVLTDPPAGNEKRDIAFNAFSDRHIKIHGTDSYADANLARGLMRYYEGQPLSDDLAARINAISDVVKLPRPPVFVARDLLIGYNTAAGASDLRAAREKAASDLALSGKPDAEEIARLQTILKNLDGQSGVSGREMFNRIATNIEMLNQLPAGERARLMGWDKLTPQQQEDLGRIPAPSFDTSRDRDKWDRLTPAQKEDWHWSKVRVDPGVVLAQIEGNVFKDGALTNLRQDLRQQMYERIGQLQTDTTRTIESAYSEKARAFQDLTKFTAKGVSFCDQALTVGIRVNPLTYCFSDIRTPNKDYAKRQGSLIEAYKEAEHKVDQTRLSSSEPNSLIKDNHERASRLQLTADLSHYTDLKNSGCRLDADKFAVRLWNQYGPHLKDLAPSIWADLTITKGRDLVGQSILHRMKERGLVYSESIPPANNELKQLDHNKRFRTALGLITEQDQGTVGLVNIKNQDTFLDKQGRIDRDFETLRQDPQIAAVIKLANKVKGDMPDLVSIVQNGESGTFFEKYADLAKEKATRIKDAFEKSGVDLQKLSTRIKDMETALAKMKQSNGDHETMVQLAQMIRQCKDMHNLLNPNDLQFKPPAGSPEELKSRSDLDTSPTPLSAMDPKLVRSSIKQVSEGGFEGKSVGEWIKQNGAVIAASLAVAGAAVVTVASWGVGSPLLLTAVGSLAGVVGEQAMQEVLYRANKDHYTGVGSYHNQGDVYHDVLRRAERGEFKDADAAEAALDKAFLDLAKQVGTDMAAFLLTAGAAKVALRGGVNPLKEFEKVLTANPQLKQQFEKAAAGAAAGTTDGSFNSFVRQVTNLSYENLKSSVRQLPGGLVLNEVVGEGVKNLPGVHLKPGEHPPYERFLCATASMVKPSFGARSQMLKATEVKGNTMRLTLAEHATPESALHDYKLQGFVVSQKEPGIYELREFQNPHQQPVKVEFVSAKEKAPTIAERPAAFGVFQAKRDSVAPRMELDVKINDLAQQIEKAKAAGQDTTHLTKQLQEEVNTEAKKVAKTMGLPPELIESGIIELADLKFAGIAGSFDPRTGRFSLDPTCRNPCDIICHELTHLKQALDRTALRRSNPTAYDNQLLESVLSDVGKATFRVCDVNLGVIDRRPVLAQSEANLMRQAVRDYAQQSPDGAPNIATIKNVAGNEKYKALVDKFGGKDDFIYELFNEVNHLRTVQNTLGAQSEEIIKNHPSLAKYVEHKQQEFSKSNRPLEDRKEMIGHVESALGLKEQSFYRFSPEEFSPTRAGIARELKHLSDQIKANLAKGEAARDAIKHAGADRINEIQKVNRAQEVFTALKEARLAETPAAREAAMQKAKDASIRLLEKVNATDKSAPDYLKFLLDHKVISRAEIPPHLRNVATSRNGMPQEKPNEFKSLDGSAKPTVSDNPKLKEWFEHDCERLQLDAEERAAVDRAVADKSLQYVVFDREFLRSHVMVSREPGARASSQAELGGDTTKYDPMLAKGPVLVVYDDQTHQYHVINGNNRVIMFGSEVANPKNLGVPVWLFNSPEAFLKTLGADPRPMRGNRFKFEDKDK